MSYSGCVEILILCKVVDNYGDIGFVYRLARALSDLDGSLRLALAVSDLSSFAYMAPGLDASLPLQGYCGWEVLDWNDYGLCSRWCRNHDVSIILECFQCGRPDWLEDYLFTGGLPDGKTARIINLEYLTAEDWAEEFHLLKSGTRSAQVKKVNFLPGFTPATGGLLLEKGFMSMLGDREGAASCVRSYLVPYIGKGAVPGLLSPDCCNVLVFSYEKDFFAVVRAFQRYNRDGGALAVYLAPGRGAASFKAAYHALFAEFTLVELPRLEQAVWDALLVSCDVLFVRGEESFARACLSSRPFLWHAYRQEAEFQLVKVSAFVNRLRSFFNPKDFSMLAEFFLLYNIDNTDNRMGGSGFPGGEAVEAVEGLFPNLVPCLDDAVWRANRIEELAYAFLCGRKRLSGAFASFAGSLVANGDLAGHLLEYLRACCDEISS